MVFLQPERFFFFFFKRSKHYNIQKIRNMINTPGQFPVTSINNTADYRAGSYVHYPLLGACEGSSTTKLTVYFVSFIHILYSTVNFYSPLKSELKSCQVGDRGWIEDCSPELSLHVQRPSSTWSRGRLKDKAEERCHLGMLAGIQDSLE